MIASPLQSTPDDFRPLRVSCQLDSAVLYSRDGLNIDGLLQYGAFVVWVEAGGNAGELPPKNDPAPTEFELPVRTWDHGDAWGWHTSDVIADWEWSEPRAYRGPTPHDKMKRYATDKGVNVSNGPFKPTDLRFESVWPRDGLLTWHVHGCPMGVAELLRHVEYIGKKHNLGAGKVRAELDSSPIWRVEEIEDDYSIIGADGRLARRMPWGFVAGGLPGFGSIRAPRWHRAQWVQSVEAGARAGVQDG